LFLFNAYGDNYYPGGELSHNDHQKNETVAAII